jgi:hypothetical protein
MPPEESLSDDLKPLAYRHALELRHTRFTADADAIVHALESVVPRRRMPWPLIGAGIAVVIVIAAGGVMWQKLKTKPAVAPAAVQTPAVVQMPVAAPPAAVAAKSAPENPATAPPPAPINPSAAPSPSPSSPQSTPAPAPMQSAALPPSATPQPGLPPGIKLGEIMPNVALRGSIYKTTDIADAPACQAACRGETRCVSWTYSERKPNDASPHCSLKAVIPQQVVEMCCSSGVERVPDPELRVALHGTTCVPAFPVAKRAAS